MEGRKLRREEEEEGEDDILEDWYINNLMMTPSIARGRCQVRDLFFCNKQSMFVSIDRCCLFATSHASLQVVGQVQWKVEVQAVWEGSGQAAA